MGRGLSQKQKGILYHAYKNMKLEDRDIDEPLGADLYLYEIPILLYGWEPDYWPLRYDEERTPGELHLSKEAKGIERYRCVMAAISRSAARLERRGYVHRILGIEGTWAGLNLTEDGAKKDNVT